MGNTTFDNHVFISYAHTDNDPTIGAWVSNFHELLEAYLASAMKRTKPKIWRDKRLSDNEVFDNSIIENLAKSAVMVAVLSDNYVLSEWCQREASEFCKQAEKTIGLAPRNLLRVFKVIKRPPETEDPLPTPLQQVTGSQFFIRMSREDRESTDENDPPFELDPGLGELFAQKLRLRVARLAQEIAEVLKEIDAELGSAAGHHPAPKKPKLTVYLAQAGDDRLEDYQTLRSELRQRGFRVVPTDVLPSTEAECRDAVEKLMSEAKLSIQLLGMRSGALPGGEGAQSVSEIQNEFAVKRGASLKRIVSLPKSAVADAVGEKHKAFLKLMLSDSVLQGECELIDRDIEAVRTAVLAAITDIGKPTPKTTTPVQKSVYVIFDRQDLAASKPIRSALAKHMIVLKPAFEGDPTEVREANFQNLAACDGVITFYGKGSEGWKAAVDGDLLRALTVRQGEPFKFQITWLDGEMTLDKEDMIGDAGVIDGFGDFDETKLDDIISAMHGGENG